MSAEQQPDGNYKCNEVCAVYLYKCVVSRSVCRSAGCARTRSSPVSNVSHESSLPLHSPFLFGLDGPQPTNVVRLPNGGISMTFTNTGVCSVAYIHV